MVRNHLNVMSVINILLKDYTLVRNYEHVFLGCSECGHLEKGKNHIFVHNIGTQYMFTVLYLAEMKDGM